MTTNELPTLEELRRREEAAQYIDNGGQYAAEMAEIQRLRALLTAAPRPVVMAAPAVPRKSVAERLGEQARDCLASGRHFDAATLRLLERLAKH